MKAFLRKLSIAALAAMLLLFAACTNDNDESASESAEKGPAGIHEPKDLGGRTIRVGALWESIIPFSAVNWDEPDPATADNYFIARMVYDNAIRVREEFNVHLEEILLSFDDAMPTLAASVMAGDPFADIMMIDGSWVLPAAMGDLILSLDSINLPGSDLLGTQVYTRYMSEAFGHRWTFLDSRPDVGGFTLGINLDIINAIGAPNPVDLYNRGQWDWDAMIEIMRLATADTTADGVPDRFGIAGQPGDIAVYLIGANDGRLVSDDFMYYIDHPNTVEALEFFDMILREGLWEYDRVHGFDVGDWSRNFFGFREGNSVFFPATSWAISGEPLPYEFAVVPWPTGPSNTSGNTWMGGWDGGFGFPQGSNWDAADILMVVEEFFAWCGDDLSLMEDYAFGWPRGFFLTEEDVHRQASARRTMASDMGMNVPQYDWVFGSFADAFARQELTVLQAIESFRGPQQEMLDNFFR